MEAEIESEMVWNRKTWETFLTPELFEKLICLLCCIIKNERDFLARFNVQ